MSNYNLIYKKILNIFQIVWASTYEVGCGAVTYHEEKLFKKIYVCNYGKAGNMQNSEMYEVGPTASNCPNGVSKEYPGLCN